MLHRARLVGILLAITSNGYSPIACKAELFMLVAAETLPGSNPTNQTPVLRFLGEDTGPLISTSSIASGEVHDPIGVTFSPWGELFIGNRHGNVLGEVGSISRFKIDHQGNYTPNGTISVELEAVHDLTFSPWGELFASNYKNNMITRFTFNSALDATLNGTIATQGVSTLGVAFSPDGELFTTGDGNTVHRYLFDGGTGGAISNGSFSIPGAAGPHFLEFNSSGELYLPDGNEVYRYLFDPGGTPSPNGIIATTDAIGVAFSPTGEMFVSGHSSGGIQRFTFDELGNASSNGTIATNSLGGLAVLDALPAPNTDSQLFWTDVNDAASHQALIRKRDADGSSGLDIKSGLGNLRGIAVDGPGQGVYWTNNGSVQATDIHGLGGVDTLVSNAGAVSVALDLEAGKIYWTASDAPSGVTDGKIRRSNLDGTNVEDVVVVGLDHPAAIAVDSANGKIYWTDLKANLDGLGLIQRANLDGSDVETLYENIDEANGLAIDPLFGRIYWTELATGKIQRGSLDGLAEIEDVLTGLDTPTAISIDLLDRRIYWTDSAAAGQDNRIETALLDGTDRQDVITGEGFPWGLAVLALYEGDLNYDGFVGISDLNIILSHWNEDAGFGNPQPGDISGDGYVGIDDLNRVLSNWNAGTPPVDTVVPEPAILSVFAVTGLCLIRRRTL